MKNTLVKMMVSVLLPIHLVLASSQLAETETFLSYLLDLVNLATVVVVALALLIFLWGLAKFIWRLGGGDDPVADGRRLMVWGLIALFVMVAVWGLVFFIADQLGITPRGAVPVENLLIPNSAGDTFFNGGADPSLNPSPDSPAILI